MPLRIQVMYTQQVNRDSYIFIETKWKGGFTHIVPCRGYDLKSQLKFHESLFWIESSEWKEVTQSEYEEHVWDTSLVADTEKTPKKTTTQSQRKEAKSPKKVGRDHSTTKQSAITATKNTRKKDSSSSQTKKRTTGSSKEKSNGSGNKRQAQQTNPPKRDNRKTKSEDSETLRDTSRKPTRTTRSQPSKLRESQVRDVCKPKKDTKRTNDSREKIPTGHRKRKRQTQ